MNKQPRDENVAVEDITQVRSNAKMVKDQKITKSVLPPVSLQTAKVQQIVYGQKM